MSNFAIDLQNIEKDYRLGETIVKVLQQIDLKIRAGEYCAIMGTSGSGKSTLMNIIGCLDRPSVGKYYLNRQAVERLTDSQLATIRNHQIGFIFQQFYLLAHISALANVMLPMVYAGIFRAERREIPT